MKTKISKTKAGEMRVDYVKIKERAQFRFLMLKKLTEAFNNDAAVLVDTNQSTSKRSGLETLERLRQAGFEPMVMKVQADREHFFGMQVDFWTKNDIEYLICLELHGKPFTHALFDILSDYDMIAGFMQIEPAANRFSMAGINAVQMMRACFQNTIYDSVICSRINSNFDISRYVEEVLNEMGI